MFEIELKIGTGMELRPESLVVEMFVQGLLLSCLIDVGYFDKHFGLILECFEVELNSIQTVQAHHVDCVLSCVYGLLAYVMVVNLQIIIMK